MPSSSSHGVPTPAPGVHDGRTPLRVSFLTVMPSPYIQDLFHAMADDPRVSLRVHYMEIAAPDTHWNSAPLPSYANVLPGRWFHFLGGRLHLNPKVLAALAADRPHLVVIGGYAGLTSQAAMLWLRLKRLPWIFWGEASGMRRLGPVRSSLRALARRPALRWPHAIAAVGSRAAREYALLASNRCPVRNIPYYCDLAPFLAIDRPAPPATSSPPFRLLYCGQLIHRKGVDLLLQAFSTLALDFPRLNLTLVGEGPLRRHLQAALPPALQSRVHFAGFHQPADLPRFFAGADAFVLPSRHDGWGVVVNQAVAAGLPVLTSDAVGAASDLVTPDNGITFPAGDANALTAAIRALLEDPDATQLMAAASRRVAADWTLPHGVDRWVSLFGEVLSTSSARRPA